MSKSTKYAIAGSFVAFMGGVALTFGATGASVQFFLAALGFYLYGASHIISKTDNE
jgi:hypothetical protein